ncbi:MAG: helix-turn-helix domain-containing protein [Pseudonocardiaceae bacterium]|nr:helix-turn-helix domain-containing protein [Pseudonocardiaceae bacterium]
MRGHGVRAWCLLSSAVAATVVTPKVRVGRSPGPAGSPATAPARARRTQPSGSRRRGPGGPPGDAQPAVAFAHVDLALSIVYGQSPALADLVARYLLIGDRRSQASFAVPAVLAQHDPAMSGFERWVRSHLDEPVQIAAAARTVGLSERTLQRLTASTVGMSPVEFVNEVRLDHATYLLRTTTLTAEAVATRVGFRNAGTLRALIRRRRGMTVRELRHG